jgi:hypothetical protein
MPTLTETRIRAARPAEKPYKVFDERGLFMLVTPSGGRLWRLRYRHGGVEKLLAIGAYPDVSLKRAREKRDDARKLLADGIDPSAKRRAEKEQQVNTFEAVAREWLVLQEKRTKVRSRANAAVFKTSCFLISVIDRSRRLHLQSCWLSSDGLSHAVPTTRLTAPALFARECFATRSRPGALSVIAQWISAGHCLR